MDVWGRLYILFIIPWEALYFSSGLALQNGHSFTVEGHLVEVLLVVLYIFVHIINDLIIRSLYKWYNIRQKPKINQ